MEEINPLGRQDPNKGGAVKKFGAREFLFERPTRLRLTTPSRTQGAGPGSSRGAATRIVSGSLTKIGVSLATHHDRQDALTMLTEPDMQARYVAATLGVIETELRKLDMPASNRQALVTLVTGAARVATRLADELEQPTHPDCDSFL